MTDIDTGEESSVLPVKTSSIVRNEFLSSNRDLNNNLVKMSFRINSLYAYQIESVCFADRQVDNATNTSLFSGSSITDTFTTGPNNIVVSTPYSFTMDETQSQWVYYRFVGMAKVYEVEIESIFRYGWVASSTKWTVDYTQLTDGIRNGLFVLAHEADTTVIITHSDNTSTQYTLSQYEVTTSGALYDSVSIRANKPIQLGGDVWHERYFINISLRDTNFLLAPYGYNSTHDHEIYIHQDNTTVQYSDAADYQSDGTFQTITYPTKGLYTMRWGNNTELRTTDYQYRTLKGVTATSYLQGGVKILKANKPVSGHQQGDARHNIQWMPPIRNEPTMAVRWQDIFIGGWWCFDNDTSYENDTFTFNVRTSSQSSHTVDVGKYTSVTSNGGKGNWTGTTNNIGSAYLISKSDSVPSDVYFMVHNARDGNGGESGMSVPLSYSSTAYVQTMNNGSADGDPAYIYSFDDGVQSIIKDTIDLVSREVLSSTPSDYDFTNDYAAVPRLGGVRYHAITLSWRNDWVYRTSSANTYISVYTNSTDKEEWTLGNIPHVHAILFTPL